MKGGPIASTKELKDGNFEITTADGDIAVVNKSANVLSLKAKNGLDAGEMRAIQEFMKADSSPHLRPTGAGKLSMQDVGPSDSQQHQPNVPPAANRNQRPNVAPPPPAQATKPEDERAPEQGPNLQPTSLHIEKFKIGSSEAQLDLAADKKIEFKSDGKVQMDKRQLSPAEQEEARRVVAILDQAGIEEFKVKDGLIKGKFSPDQAALLEHMLNMPVEGATSQPMQDGDYQTPHVTSKSSTTHFRISTGGGYGGIPYLGSFGRCFNHGGYGWGRRFGLPRMSFSYTSHKNEVSEGGNGHYRQGPGANYQAGPGPAPYSGDPRELDPISSNRHKAWEREQGPEVVKYFDDIRREERARKTYGKRGRLP